MTGEELDPLLVMQARRIEMAFFRRMGVYVKVGRSECEKEGLKVIDVGWVDISKGSREKPDYRSRLVGKDFKRGSLPELFAATPPWKHCDSSKVKLLQSTASGVEVSIFW